jgi:hypothetical protein
MAINWNNVAAPNLGESNSLFAQAIQSLKDAGAGLKDTAKDYQTVVRNRSHAILQDYINSAKTPEELQSEAFNTGFKNLQATLANEYDAVKVNDYRDSAVDKLTKRAGDAVALEANRFALSDGQRKAAQDVALAEAVGLDASGQLQGDTLASYMAKVGGQGALELSKQRDARDVNGTNAEIKIRENQIKTMEEERKEREYRDGQPLRTLNSYVAGAQLNEIKGDNPQLRSPTYKSTVGTFGKNALDNKESVLGQKVFNIAKENGVDGELLYTLASIESNWNPNATSEKGAQGLIQLMPQYNKERGVTNALDIDQNIKGASVYVKQLQKQFGDDQEKIVAAYNAGAGGVQKAIDAASEDGSDWRSKLPDETKTYLNRYKDLITYLRTGNNGSDLKLPSGLKTDSYTQPSTATGKAKADHVLKMWSAVETANKGIEAAKLGEILKTDPTKTLDTWYQTAINDGNNIDPNNIKEAIESNPDSSKLSDAEKVYIAATALQKKENGSWTGTRSWTDFTGSSKKEVTDTVNTLIANRGNKQDALFNTTLKPAYMEGIRAEAKKSGVGSLYEAAKNIDVDELSIYKLGIKSPVVDKAKVLYASLADKSQPEGAYIEEYLQNLSNSPDTSTAEAKSNVEKAGTSKVPVNTPTVKPPTIVNNLNPDGTVKGVTLSADAQARLQRLDKLIASKSTDPITRRALQMQKERLLSTGA